MNFSKQEILLLTTNEVSVLNWQELHLFLDGADLEMQKKYCENIAKQHYENFPVASVLLPKKVRKNVYPIYAFARLIDDIADECNFFSKEEKIQCLNFLINSLKEVNKEDYSNNKFFHPILFPLSLVIEQEKLPIEEFERLIIAFKLDVNFKGFKKFEDLGNYSSFSANPVGLLILSLFKELNLEDEDKKKELIENSNNLCTALQLVNFWQDISIDKHQKRFYVPIDILKRYNISVEEFYFGKNNGEVKLSVLNEIYLNTSLYFESSKKLPKLIKNKRLKFEILVIYFAGKVIFQKINSLKLDILEKRPTLNSSDYLFIVLKSIKGVFKY